MTCAPVELGPHRPGQFEHGGVPLNDSRAKDGTGTGSSFEFNEDGYVDADGRYDSPVELAAHMISPMEDMDTGTLETNAAKPGEPAATEVKAVQMQNLTNPQDPKTTYVQQPVPEPTKVPEIPPLPKGREKR